MAFVNDPLFLGVAEVTLSYTRAPGALYGTRIKNYLPDARAIIRSILVFVTLSIFIFTYHSQPLRNGERSRVRLDRIIIRR